MKTLKLILQQVLVLLLAITALNSQAKNDFKFTNYNDGRETKIEVEKVSRNKQYFLKITSVTRSEDGNIIVMQSREIELNADGTGGQLPSRVSGEGQESKPLEFSLLTRDLLRQMSQTGQHDPGYVLMPFGFFSDDSVNSNGLLTYMTVTQAEGDENYSHFTVRGYLNEAQWEGEDSRILTNVEANVVFDPDNAQLTEFEIHTTGVPSGSNFRGRLQSDASRVQDADGQDEQSVGNDPEASDGDKNASDKENEESVESDPESQIAYDDGQDKEETDDEQSDASDPESEVTDGGQAKKETDDEQSGASDPEPEVTDGGQDKEETDDEQPGASDSEPEVTDGGQDKEEPDDEQPGASDSESKVADGNQDEEGIKDNQPDDSKTLPINIPTVDQSLPDGLQTRTPADQLESRAGVFGSVSGAGVESIGDTKGK